MARRRAYEDLREPVSVFNLSFLDVFACALGALILILLIIFNQVSLTFDNETIKGKIKAIEQKKGNVVEKVREGIAVEAAARQWDATKEQTLARITELEAELKEKQSAAAQFPGVTTETVEQARQVVAQVQSQTVRQRESTNNLWFGTGSISQRVRLVEVYDGRYIDHGQKPPRQYTTAETNDLVDILRRVRGAEYPLFIIRPDGVMQWRELEPRIEAEGLLYGFEPYTKAWNALLPSEGAAP